MAMAITAIPICAQTDAQNLQSLSAEHLMARRGDCVVKQQISYVPLGRRGSHVLWNLSDVEVQNGRYCQNFIKTPENPDNVVTGIEHGTRYHYATMGDTLVVRGVENNGLRMVYDEMPAELRFPLQLGTELQGLYHGRGVCSGNRPFREFGEYHVKADAEGTLLLPSGDTLHHVIRVHSVRKTGTRFYDNDSICDGSRLVKFTRDSVLQAMRRDSMTINENYRWYAPGYRYPVLETVAVGSTERQLRTTAFLFAPEEQAVAYTDEVNQPLRKSHSFGGIGNDVGFKYNITRSDGNEQIRLDYILEHESMVSCQLVTAGGAVVWQQPTSRLSAGTYTAEIPSEAVRQGVNLLSFKVDGKIFTEKFTVRK